MDHIPPAAGLQLMAEGIGRALGLLLFFRGKLGVFFPKPVDTAGRVHETLLTGKKRMTAGADFNVNLLSGSGRGCKLISAGANDLGFKKLGMDFLFHGIKPPW
jgi:hypothetical protein